jgi:tripartite ATP-independent transporter DctP family solute receptor
MQTRRKSIQVIGAAAASILAPSIGRAQSPRKLRFGHVLTEQHPYHLGLVKFGKELERLTNGSVTVAVYSGGQLGGEVKLIEGLGLGIVDGCAVAASSLALTSGQKKFYLLDLPFLFANFEAVERVATSSAAQQLTTSRPGAGVRILGLATAGFHQMLNSKKPIKTPDDLKGMKFRVWESPSASLALEMIGMTPTPMAFGEVFTAIQQGVVDGFTNSLTTFYLSKMYEVGKFVSVSNHQYGCVVPMISESTFASLKKNEQDAVVQAGKEACRYWRALYPPQDAEFRPKLAAAGCHINGADRAAFVRHVRPQYKRFAQLVGEPGTDKLIDQMVEAAGA